VITDQDILGRSDLREDTDFLNCLRSIGKAMAVDFDE